MFILHAKFWIYAATWLPFVLCTLAYGLRSPWWRAPIGRALFTLLTSMTVVLTFAVAVQIGAVPDGVIDVLRWSLAGVAVAGWVLLVQILRIQREARRCKEKQQ